MSKITGQRVGGKFLLSEISYALDDEKRIMVNEGSDDEQKSPVTVLTISQEIKLDDDDIDRLVKLFQDRSVNVLVRGSHQRARYVVMEPTQYEIIAEVFQNWLKPVKEQIPPPPDNNKQPGPQAGPPIGTPPRLKVPRRNRVIVVLGVVTILLVLVVAAVLFSRKIVSIATPTATLIVTPTATPTATPTPSTASGALSSSDEFDSAGEIATDESQKWENYKYGSIDQPNH